MGLKGVKTTSLRAPSERGALRTGEVTLYRIKRHPGGELSVTSCQGGGGARPPRRPPSEDLEVYPLLLTSPVSSHTAKTIQLY